MAKYTFLVPAFKPDFLDKAIESMLNQSFEDFKILISNDCSPYDIKSVIDKYDDSRIFYRENSSNIGGERLIDHWNLLLGMCDSTYLIIAADDDIYDKDFLKSVDEKSLMYPNVDVIRTRTCRINGNDDVIDTESLCDAHGTQLDATWNSFCSNQIWCVGNYVFKTEPLKREGGFVDFPYAWFSDLATALMMSKNGMCYTDKCGFRFRLSDTNISNTKKNRNLDRQKLYATLQFGEWLCDFFSKMNDCDSILSRRRKQQAFHKSQTVIYSGIGDYGWAIGYFDLFRVYRKLSQWPGFSKGSFIKNYALAALARRVGKYV